MNRGGGKKQLFFPEDGMCVQLTLITLYGTHESGVPLVTEIFVGGCVNSNYIVHFPAYKEFAKRCRVGAPIQIDCFSYKLNGVDWHTRKATHEEMKQIIDGDFPHSYSADVLQPIDHEGPDMFKLKGGIMCYQGGYTESSLLF